MKDLRLIENTNEIRHHFVKVFQFVTNRGVINGNDQNPHVRLQVLKILPRALIRPKTLIREDAYKKNNFA